MSRVDIEGYTGEGDLPPYCEMTVNATGLTLHRGEIKFFATLKGMEKCIMIHRTYEPLCQPSASTAHPQLQSLTDPQQPSTRSTAIGNSKIAYDEVLMYL